MTTRNNRAIGTRNSKSPNADNMLVKALLDVEHFDGSILLESLSEFEAFCDKIYKGHDEWVKNNHDLINSHPDGVSYAEDGYFRYGGAMPTVLRAAIFTYSYGKFEFALHNLCCSVQTGIGAKLGPNDLKDRGIVRSRTYLELVIGVMLPDDLVERLDALCVYGRIRNAVVHNNGVLCEKDKETECFIRKNKHILSEERLLVFQSPFNFEVIQLMQETWGLLYDTCMHHFYPTQDG